MKFWGREFTENFSLPFYLGVANLAVEGFSIEDKFWSNPDIDTSTTPEDVREEGGLYTFSANGVSDIDKVVSSDINDTNILVQIDGLDIDGYLQTGYANVNGQNVVNIYANTALTGDPISFWRVHRMQNVSGETPGTTAKNIVGNVYCFVDSTVVAGVPSDKTKIRAKTVNGNNQSQMAIYTIPKGKRGFLIKWDLGITREQTSGAAITFQYQSRRYGGVFKVKKSVWVQTAGNSYFVDHRDLPDVIPELTDIKITATGASANDTSVFATFQIILIDQ